MYRFDRAFAFFRSFIVAFLDPHLCFDVLSSSNCLSNYLRSIQRRPIAERIPIADFSQAPPSLSGLHTRTNVFIPSSRGKRYRGVHPLEDCSMARKFVRLCAKERRMEGTANEIDVQKS